MSVFLTSSDGKSFTMDKEAACQSNLIKFMLEDLGESDSPIPLMNVNSQIMEKVIEYANYHKDKKDEEDWDINFICSLDKDTLYRLIMAADFLDMRNLFNTGCQRVADTIIGKTYKEVFGATFPSVQDNSFQES
jgi:S-phase kinase-associated protein 1